MKTSFIKVTKFVLSFLTMIGLCASFTGCSNGRVATGAVIGGVVGGILGGSHYGRRHNVPRYRRGDHRRSRVRDRHPIRMNSVENTDFNLNEQALEKGQYAQADQSVSNGKGTDVYKSVMNDRYPTY